MRIADTLRAFAVVAFVFAASKATLTVAYYAFPPGAYATFKQLLDIAVTVWAVVYLASLRRASRGIWFRAAWGSATLLVILGVSGLGSLTQKRMGMPQVDHHVQPPLASVTGPRRSLSAYFDRLDEASNTAAERAAEVNAKHSAARAARARVSASAAAGTPPGN